MWNNYLGNDFDMSGKNFDTKKPEEYLPLNIGPTCLKKLEVCVCLSRSISKSSAL